MRLLLFISIAIAISSCSSLKNTTKFADNSVVAHRGAWKANGFPENSIASLREAIRLNCRGSEFDVRMTSDDSLVINHDPHFNELTVEKSTYQELQAFKLSNGEKLPTLREYLLAGIKNNKHTQLVCEIKPSDINKQRGIIVARKVLQTVKELNAQKKICYISFDYDILKEIHRLDPQAFTQYLEANKSPEELKKDGISGADYYFTVFKDHPEWLSSAKENNITLNAWTVNDTTQMDWLIKHDFDFITTNYPELLFKRIKLNKKKSNKLIWADEFNYKGAPDKDKWNYDIGNGADGWGNQELEYYTNKTDNVKVENGVLKINAIKEDYEGKHYTSSRLNSKGKFDFTYGTIEVRAKMPTGVGTWPAIWMLGSNIDSTPWPACGEIDIMEHLGRDQNNIYGTFHYPNHSGINANGKTKKIVDATQFHIYKAEWSASSIDLYVDNQLIHTLVNSPAVPFNHNFFLIINLAMGGNFAGPVNQAVTGASLEVDYVRVYK
nr:family 16 glycosylhydrolase [uncultured Pedobacter sp.]